ETRAGRDETAAALTCEAHLSCVRLKRGLVAPQTSEMILATGR
ncbi:MAG: hypothetical protein ACI8X5_003512, partial [Planctomycetota bacterium]